jgi:hypothetical protein
MSAKTTYGLTATIAGAAITALIDAPTQPELEAIEPVDDSRHGDTDGIARFVPSGRKQFTSASLIADDVASCPGIAAARAAVGGAAVAVVITNANTGGVVTVNALIQSVLRGPSPLTGKQQVTITYQATPVRA